MLGVRAQKRLDISSDNYLVFDKSKLRFKPLSEHVTRFRPFKVCNIDEQFQLNLKNVFEALSDILSELQPKRISQLQG